MRNNLSRGHGNTFRPGLSMEAGRRLALSYSTFDTITFPPMFMVNVWLMIQGRKPSAIPHALQQRYFAWRYYLCNRSICDWLITNASFVSCTYLELQNLLTRMLAKGPEDRYLLPSNTAYLSPLWGVSGQCVVMDKQPSFTRSFYYTPLISNCYSDTGWASMRF